MSGEWSAKNPYSTTITERYVLNGPGAKKETCHIAFDLGDSGMTYKVGDALGVLPENPPALVEALIQRMGWDADSMVTTSKGERTLAQALKTDVEIHRANKKFVQSLASKITRPGLPITMGMIRRTREDTNGSTVLDWNNEASSTPPGLNPSVGGQGPADQVEAVLATPEALEDYIWSRDYLDIVEQFELKYEPQEFIDLVDRLKPRLYSISSSPDAHPGLVELTVGIVRYAHHGRERGGLCTVYLADEVDVDRTKIGVFMSPTKSFVLPEDGATDIIMVGPGTGIAPFRAFMEQRVHDGATGRNWLFFGDWSESTEFYYEDTIKQWMEDGSLTTFTSAWSRDQEEKIYVQHRMLEHGEEMWSWIDGGAYFYICGDKNRMAKDVHAALIRICAEHGGMTEDEATHFVEKRMMREEKRYLRDVY